MRQLLGYEQAAKRIANIRFDSGGWIGKLRFDNEGGRRMKKLKPMLLVVMVCMLALLGIPAAAKAAAAPVCPKKQTIMIEKWRAWTSGEQYTDVYDYIFIGNLSSNAKVVNIKSSNPKFKATKGDGINAILVEHDMYDKEDRYIKTKSGEKTKISFTVKQNGKTYNLFCEVICVPFHKEFKNFQIGSQGCASLFNGYQEAFKKINKSGKEKLTIKTTAEYKLKKINLYYKNKERPIEVKNGVLISLKNLEKIEVNYETLKKPLYYKKPGKGLIGKGSIAGEYMATLYLDNAPWVPGSSLAI